MKSELMLRGVLRSFLLAFVVATSLLLSCSDDPEPTNESELITTLNLSFQKVDDLGDPVGDPLIFTFEDLDGDGSGDPEIDDITLEADATYLLTVQLLDNSSPGSAEDITEEVMEEADEHQLFFITTTNTLLSVVYADVESDYIDGGSETLPVGLLNTVTTANAGAGTFTVVLVHEPNKNAEDAQDGVYSDLVGGSEDIRVEFNLAVN